MTLNIQYSKKYWVLQPKYFRFSLCRSEQFSDVSSFFFLPKITTRVYFHQWFDLLIQVPEEVRKGLMILISVNLNHRKLSEKVNFRIFFLLVFGSCCKRDD